MHGIARHVGGVASDEQAPTLDPSLSDRSGEGELTRSTRFRGWNDQVERALATPAGPPIGA
jgi:hypothetical protein